MSAYQPQLFGGDDLEVLDTDSWCTPEGDARSFGLVHVRAFFASSPSYIELEPEIDLDPCSNTNSTVRAAVSYTIADDGLAHAWDLDIHGRPTRIWVNNPYSDPEPWMKRSAEAFDAGAEVLALPKGDWSTRWWNTYVRRAPARVQLSRRLSFVSGGGGNSANFPSALVYWGERVDEFAAHFGRFGEVVRDEPPRRRGGRCEPRARPHQTNIRQPSLPGP